MDTELNDSFGEHNVTFDEDFFAPLYSWSWWLLQIGTPVIVLLGLPGNVLSIVIMKSRLYRHKSYSHYLSALAVFDSLVLVGKFLHRLDAFLAYAGTTRIVDLYGDVACKVTNFAEHVCYLMSGWLVLCMSVERFIAVLFPLKKDLFCRQRNAVTIIVILFASLSYSQIFRLVIFGINSGSCEAADVYRSVYVILHVYLYQLILQFLLPAVLIFALNVAILHRLRRHGRGRDLPLQRAASCASAEASTQKRRPRKTTCMLLVIAFTYLITILPLLIVSLAMHIALLTDLAVAKWIFANLEELRLVLELLSEVNYASNFYIYVLTGAHFRLAVCKLLRFKQRRRSSYTFSCPMTTSVERLRTGSRSSNRKMTSFSLNHRTAEI